MKVGIQIGKNGWDLETWRKVRKKSFFIFEGWVSFERKYLCHSAKLYVGDYWLKVSEKSQINVNTVM